MNMNLGGGGDAECGIVCAYTMFDKSLESDRDHHIIMAL